MFWLPSAKSKKMGEFQNMNKLGNKWRTGHFLGIEEGSDDAYIGVEDGMVTRARSLKRMPEKMRKSGETLLKIQ